MQPFSAAASAAVLLLAGWQLAGAGASKVTPVQKVVELLENMLAKGKEEKHAEQVQFAAYKQFCDDTEAEKKRAIEEAEERIEMLKATIEKNTQDAAQLAKEIAQHDADIAAWEGDKKAATKVRELEKADYQALHTDYSESVDALQRAIAYLKTKSRTVKQASLAQVKVLKDLKSLSLIPAEAKRALDAFVQEDPVDAQASESLSVTAPEANAYETNLGGIIEMLEKLLDKFIDEKTAVEKEEMNARHAYELLLQDLEAQIKQGTTDREEKSIFKSKKLQAKADAEGDLTDTTTTRDEDQKYLAELTGTCSQKAGDFESRQQLRAEEIEAVSKAIEILSNEKVQKLGNAQSFAQKGAKSATALASLRSDGRSPVQEKVAAFLRSRSEQLNSRMLSALAVRVADDPFAKVKKMIKDLIVRLMEEANEEAEHKGWCDTELSTNEQTRKEKTQAVETLHAEIDELEASVAKLTEEISGLTAAVAQLDADMAEATQLRVEEKKANELTIKDSQEAQTAVAQALAVLKEFYARAGESTALVQKRQAPEAPEIFGDAPYRGMTGESGGVIGMLEVIESDFARIEADTTASEATSQKQYDELMTTSKVDKASKSKDIEHKAAKKQDQEQALTMKASDLQGTQKELDAALAYFDKLKPSCVDSGVSYEDRVARRKEEIESLQEALKILNGEDIA
jgi:hypothetical protein